MSGSKYEQGRSEPDNHSNESKSNLENYAYIITLLNQVETTPEKRLALYLEYRAMIDIPLNKLAEELGMSLADISILLKRTIPVIAQERSQFHSEILQSEDVPTDHKIRLLRIQNPTLSAKIIAERVDATEQYVREITRDLYSTGRISSPTGRPVSHDREELDSQVAFWRNEDPLIRIDDIAFALHKTKGQIRKSASRLLASRDIYPVEPGVGRKGLVEREALDSKVAFLKIENPLFTQEKIAEILGEKKYTVKRSIRRLADSDVLERDHPGRKANR